MTPQTVGQSGDAESGGLADPRSTPLPVEPADVSTSELVKRLSTQLSELVRGELELARTELTAKGKRAGAGGIVALYGVAALIAAAIAGLALVLPLWLSALLIGVVLLIVAGVLALLGRNQLRGATPPVPEQAVDSVQRDVRTVKEAVQR
jgi:Flp pilus assembly protein TadB